MCKNNTWVLFNAQSLLKLSNLLEQCWVFKNFPVLALQLYPG